MKKPWKPWLADKYLRRAIRLSSYSFVKAWVESHPLEDEATDAGFQKGWLDHDTPWT